MAHWFLAKSKLLQQDFELASLEPGSSFASG